MAYADANDVAARLGRELTGAEADQVSALLEDAETIIRNRVTDLDSRVDADDLYLALVVLVEVKAARRVMLNPEGYRQRSESVDDFSQSNTLDVSISSSEVYVSSDEFQLLGLGSGSAGSFSMARNYL